MNKKNVNNREYETNLLSLIDRISSFKCSRVDMGIWDDYSQSYERVTIKDPGDLRINLETSEVSDDPIYAFSVFLPEINNKIYAAHKDRPIKISLEADLPSGLTYTVMVYIHPDLGMTNLDISPALRLDAYQDPVCPRVYGDFFLGGKRAA